MMSFRLRVTEKALSNNDHPDVVKSWQANGECNFTWFVDRQIDATIRERMCDGFSEVVCVQADGQELEWVQENISGIRMNKAGIIFWTGEDARFIVDSLPVDWSK